MTMRHRISVLFSAVLAAALTGCVESSLSRFEPLQKDVYWELVDDPSATAPATGPAATQGLTMTEQADLNRMINEMNLTGPATTPATAPATDTAPVTKPAATSGPATVNPATLSLTATATQPFSLTLSGTGTVTIGTVTVNTSAPAPINKDWDTFWAGVGNKTVESVELVGDTLVGTLKDKTQWQVRLPRAIPDELDLKVLAERCQKAGVPFSVKTEAVTATGPALPNAGRPDRNPLPATAAATEPATLPTTVAATTPSTEPATAPTTVAATEPAEPVLPPLPPEPEAPLIYRGETPPPAPPGKKYVKHERVIDPNQTARLVYRTNYDYLYNRAMYALTEMGYSLDRTDYRLGVLITYPKYSAHMIEVWRPDHSTVTAAAENMLHSQRRTLRVTISRSPNPAYYEVAVQVMVDRETNPREHLGGASTFHDQGSGFGRNLQTLRSDYIGGNQIPEDAAAATQPAPKPPAATPPWHTVGRDKALESKLLDKIAGGL